jgi:hypothetical protein
MYSLKAVFKPDYDRYEGVRPIYEGEARVR